MKRNWWIAGGGAVLLVVALTAWLLPLRWVTSAAAPDLAARRVTGSVWHGRLEQAEWRGLDLGDIDVALDPAGLRAGEVRLDFARAATALSGRIVTGGGAHRLEALTGALRVPLASAHVKAIDLDLREAAISVDAAGRCAAASGVVAARLSGLPLIGDSPVIEGVMRCDGDVLVLPLMSADGYYGVDLRLTPDRRYRADIRVKVESRLVQMGLAAAGFAAKGVFSQISIEGQL